MPPGSRPLQWASQTAEERANEPFRPGLENDTREFFRLRKKRQKEEIPNRKRIGQTPKRERGRKFPADCLTHRTSSSSGCCSPASIEACWTTTFHVIHLFFSPPSPLRDPTWALAALQISCPAKSPWPPSVRSTTKTPMPSSLVPVESPTSPPNAPNPT